MNTPKVNVGEVLEQDLPQAKQATYKAGMIAHQVALGVPEEAAAKAADQYLGYRKAAGVRMQRVVDTILGAAQPKATA